MRPTGKFRIVEVTPGKTEKMEYATHLNCSRLLALTPDTEQSGHIECPDHQESGKIWPKFWKCDPYGAPLFHQLTQEQRDYMFTFYSRV